jgi:predicted nucleic acid-binding protein
VSHLVVATNAGPLIYLSVLGRLPLLRDLFAEILLPDAVYEEVVLHGHGLPGANETKAAVEDGWLRRAVVQNRALVDALLGDLDIGEAEAIALARELGLRWILMDDRSARAKARLMGLTVTGTIGVLLLARRSGMDVDLQRDLDLLIEHNFRISHQLYEQLIVWG